MKLVSGKQIAKSFQVGDEQYNVLMNISVTINKGSSLPLWGPLAVGNRHSCMHLVGWTLSIMGK